MDSRLKYKFEDNKLTIDLSELPTVITAFERNLCTLTGNPDPKQACLETVRKHYPEVDDAEEAYAYLFTKWLS